MKTHFELQHKELARVRLDVDGETLVDCEVDQHFAHTIEFSKSTRVEAWFWPWKIEPLLRLNGHMLNYGLLGVDQYDHQLVFDLHRDFLSRYRDAMIDSRIQAQFPNGEINNKLYESTIGYNTPHTQLVAQIKNTLS